MLSLEKPSLYEYLSNERSHLSIFEESATAGGTKHTCMKGIFIQGDVRNQNQRVYPTREIARAVESMNKRIHETNGISGEIDHPAELSINLDRISHIITEMWIDGSDGYGKLKLVPTPMGNIIKVLLESGLKLGVSSRGSGNVGDDGVVSDFEIVTVDIVANPSAPNAYPRVIYESLFNMKGGARMFETARFAHEDPSAHKHTVKDMIKFIDELKI